MTENEIREHVVEAFDTASVVGFQYDDCKVKFLQQQGDIHFSELEIDSLAAMEVCIAIELSTGISIVPQEFIRTETMNNFVSVLMEKMR